MVDIPEMFRPTRGFSMKNVVWPTLVAIATKFGLGAETKWPTGLFLAVLDVNSVVLTLTNINSVAMREVYCIVYSFCRYRLLLCCDDGQ